MTYAQAAKVARAMRRNGWAATIYRRSDGRLIVSSAKRLEARKPKAAK